jgi:hypothetical protein
MRDLECQGGEQAMPKDPSRNVDRYKVRGGHINEYDFEKGKAADRKQNSADKNPFASKDTSKKAVTSNKAATGKKAASRKKAKK